jgi:hypothetical protein
MPDAVQYPMGEKIIIKYFSYKNNATLGINFYIKNENILINNKPV